MDAVKTGGLIAQVRKEKALTQKDLAEQLHVSVQAVSKWERGRSCPDIALLEPLAEALELTVTELLSGQRGEEPKEEVVRDSLRFGQDQLGPKVKRWRWLFAVAALALAGMLLWAGYVWLRDNTELLPQRETVVTHLDGKSDREIHIAEALGGSSNALYLYEVLLADDVTEILIEAELWTHEDGLVDRWTMMEQSAGGGGREQFGPRRQIMVLNMDQRVENWSEEDGQWETGWFDYGVSLGGGSTRGRLDEIPSLYMGNGFSVSRPTRTAAAVDREEGTVLLTISMYAPGGGAYAPGGLPPEHDGAVYLVVRMYCC